MTDIIRERRSIRRFTEQPIEQEKLEEIIEAARWAPSWGNLQCSEIVIVKETDKKKKLAELLSAKNPATKVMENGPLVIVVCGRPGKSGYYKGKQQTRYQHWFMYDLGIVSQNICLKAYELGLGSVMVGSFDHPKVEELLNVPAGCEVVALIPIGYPGHSPSPPKRKAVEDFVHFEKF